MPRGIFARISITMPSLTGCFARNMPDSMPRGFKPPPGGMRPFNVSVQSSKTCNERGSPSG
jgi:hypothetical protein